MNTTYTTPEQSDEEKVLARIEKMLRLADGNKNENEAATALALAQQMADAYNIDIEGLRGKTPGKAGARDDKSFSGGLYPYQRKLFEAIAKLNHCLYWTKKGTYKGAKFEHRIVGSKLNVLLARQMGDYLQGTVERLAREYAGDHTQYFTKRTHCFRDGVVDRLIGKIEDKRQSDLRDANAKKAEQAARARHPGAATENALVTIDDVIQREREANYNFQYGEGAWEKAQVRRAEQANRIAAAEQAAAEWAKNNPEAYAKQQAEAAEQSAKYWREYEKRQARNAERRTGRYVSTKLDRTDYTGYYAGQDAGANVSLDRQVDHTVKARIS